VLCRDAEAAGVADAMIEARSMVCKRSQNLPTGSSGNARSNHARSMVFFVLQGASVAYRGGA